MKFKTLTEHFDVVANVHEQDTFESRTADFSAVAKLSLISAQSALCPLCSRCVHPTNTGTFTLLLIDLPSILTQVGMQEEDDSAREDSVYVSVIEAYATESSGGVAECGGGEQSGGSVDFAEEDRPRSLLHPTPLSRARQARPWRHGH